MADKVRFKQGVWAIIQVAGNFKSIADAAEKVFGASELSGNSEDENLEGRGSESSLKRANSNTGISASLAAHFVEAFNAYSKKMRLPTALLNSNDFEPVKTDASPRAATCFASTSSLNPSSNREAILVGYVQAMKRRFEKIRLPLPMEQAKHLIPVSLVRLTLPVIVLKDHALRIVEQSLLSKYTEAVRREQASDYKWELNKLEPEAILGGEKRTLIIGDPGSGKSTFLTGLAYRLASEWLVDPSKPIPILFECNDHIGNKTPTNFREIVSMALEKWVPEDLDLVVRYAEAGADGSVVLLVDGLDEIVEAQQPRSTPERRSASGRKQFCQTLVRLSALYPKASIIVTSRPHGIDEVRQELTEAFEILRIAPLPYPEKQMSLRAMCEAVGHRDVMDAQRHVLEHDGSIANLSDTFLMLALSAQVYWNAPDQFPDTRPQLLDVAVKQMIERRQDQEDYPVTISELMPRLEFLALQMREAGEVRILRKQAVDSFAEFSRQDRQNGSATRRDQDLLAAAIHPVGVLALASKGWDDSSDELKFVHQSFQEYFAARAIRHGRTGQEPLDRLKELTLRIEVAMRSVRERYKISQEPVVSGDFQETMRMCIAQLPELAVDKSFTHILCERGSAPKRALAVFSMMCLVDGPAVKDATLYMIFESFLGCIENMDMVAGSPRSSWDEALLAVSLSKYGSKLHEYLLTGFLSSTNVRRHAMRRSLVWSQISHQSKLNVENANQFIDELHRGLASLETRVRAKAVIVFWVRCSHTNGKLGFLADEQKDRVIERLVAAAETDAGLRDLYLGTLCTFVGALPQMIRDAEITNLSTYELSNVWRLIHQCQNYEIGMVALLATMETPITQFVYGVDWIYEAAELADARRPRREWQKFPPRPEPRSIEQNEHVRKLLSRFQLQTDSAIDQERIAIALARFGIVNESIIRVMGKAFTNLSENRDEITIHLGLSGYESALEYFVPTLKYTVKEDPYESRGLFGILMADNLRVLEQQFMAANPNICQELAYGIAGSKNREEGLRILQQHATSKNLLIANAANKALQKRREWDYMDGQNHANPKSTNSKHASGLDRLLSFFDRKKGNR